MPMRSKIALAALGGLVMLACTSLRAPSHAEGPAARVEAGHVLVDGIATIQVIPDVVDMNLTLTAEHSSPREAVAALRAQQEALLVALPGAAGSDAEIHAGQLRLSTDWRRFHERREAPVHTASMTIVVSLAALDRMGEVLSVGTEHGVTSASSRYRSTVLPEKKKAVRVLALRAAADKAEQSAALMGVHLGEVVSIEEISGGWGWGGGGVENNFVAAPSATPSTPGAAMPGAIDLSLTVEVRYALQ
ncbi:MAG: hypothetical protein ACI8S6_003124 [Myxococcota bacterium]|jgi:uncharacterized protein YggE